MDCNDSTTKDRDDTADLRTLLVLWVLKRFNNRGVRNGAE